MNQVYLNKDGKVFVNGNEIRDVSSISTNTTWTGSEIIISFNGDYQSDYQSDIKTHPLDEKKEDSNSNRVYRFVDDLDDSQKITVELVCTIISVICIALAVIITCLNLSK